MQMAKGFSWYIHFKTTQGRHTIPVRLFVVGPTVLHTHSMNSSSFAYTTTRRKETRKSRQKHVIAPYSSNDSRRRAYHLQKHFQNPLLLFTYWLGGLGRESFKQSKSN